MSHMTLDQYLNTITRDLEEARDAMHRQDPQRAKCAVRAALTRPRPDNVDAAETTVLTALALGVVEPEPVVDLAAARAGKERH